MNELSQEEKVQIIKSRLYNITRNHYELSLDLVQAEANSKQEEIDYTRMRMDEMMVNYNAIKALLTDLE